MSKRKQERENEQTLKAAKSRSKGTDPEKVAKLREEAKQVSTKTGLFIRGCVFDADYCTVVRAPGTMYMYIHEHALYIRKSTCKYCD